MGMDAVNRVSHVYLMGRDSIFGMSKGYLPRRDVRMKSEEKKGRDPKVSASRFDCLKNEKVQLGSALLLKVLFSRRA